MTNFIKSFLMALSWHGRQVKMTPKNVIVITGCDSGLGFSFANFCHSLNMTVISACHNINSEGARLLQDLSASKRMFTIELDLLEENTISNAREQIMQLLEQNPNYELTALVNNAGCMCFGEFEWQTMAQIEMQLNVNLLGTIRLTKALLPILRIQKSRIINITSHCGLQALPALSTYAASKAGLRAWNDALRIEMSQYNVDVIDFIPGSHIMESNIAARQQQHTSEMWHQLDEEQKHFYGNYFHKFNEYLSSFTGPRPANRVQDKALLDKFQAALTNTKPKAIYIHEPLRYKIYRILFQICPTPLVDWLCVKFCALPTYSTTKGSAAATEYKHISDKNKI